MKLLLALGLCLVAVALALPSEIIDIELDNMEHEQEGEPGHEVEGEYSWKAPNGEEYVVKYKADEDGFRVVDSNVVPETHDAEDDDDDFPKFRAVELDDDSLED